MEGRATAFIPCLQMVREQPAGHSERERMLVSIDSCSDPAERLLCPERPWIGRFQSEQTSTGQDEPLMTAV